MRIMYMRARWVFTQSWRNTSQSPKKSSVPRKDAPFMHCVIKGVLFLWRRTRIGCPTLRSVFFLIQSCFYLNKSEKEVANRSAYSATVVNRCDYTIVWFDDFVFTSFLFRLISTSGLIPIRIPGSKSFHDTLNLFSSSYIILKEAIFSQKYLMVTLCHL